MRWLFPETPDVIGLLRRQLAVTIDGLDAFVAWADGEAVAEGRVRECEHRADDLKRELHRTLREAFVTPLEPGTCSRSRAGSTASSTRSRTPCANRT